MKGPITQPRLCAIVMKQRWIFTVQYQGCLLIMYIQENLNIAFSRVLGYRFQQLV